MSSVVIAGDTSGTVTLQAPAVAGSTVLNLPTVSGGTLVTSDSSGDVIVGSTVTATGLGAIERFRIIGAGSGISGGPSAFAQFRYANDNTGIFQRAYKSRNNNVNGHTAVQNGDLVYQFSALGSDGAAWKQLASLNINVDGAVSAGVVPGSMIFSTVNSSGTMTNRFAAFSNGNFQFDSGYGSVATAYGCRAWVNFNGTGTVAIRASGNVSSITDNGTGDYTVNFTTAMPDVNYAFQGSVESNTGSDQRALLIRNGGMLSSSSRIVVKNDANGFEDCPVVAFSVFR
jgi:hypothetical protein